MPLYANWRALIIFLLEDKNNYVRTSDVTSLSDNAASLIFEKDAVESKNKIEVTILESGALVALRLSNPLVPGYNEFSFGEYFYSLQFSTPPDYGAPGLDYNQKNIEGVKSILREGIKGKEVQYYREDVVLKSEVHFTYSGQVFKYKYNFTERSLWRRIFGKKVSNFNNIGRREIDLNKIFPPLFID
ncbi:MAG: hypothetical protein JXR05_03580 [Flavobacteriaceae bacterium]